ncbi:hypothetical protein [Simplicispira suum]|uniref:Uncharacterized protein n=1 Tax=Simplicispira suum TaxID=2109915 RepID=A0A2S0N3M1_9BURK|nr:hypothetical protein [Simplicispira suum]AVO42740.1 hypothetical protein C6571_16845 [Simplicispira suum]
MPNFAIGDVLDRVRAAHGLESDYQLFKRYGFSMQKLGNWRHGRALPDEKACRILAEAAGLDPLVLLAQVQAQRSQSTEARTLWEAVALRLSHASAGLAAAIFSVLIATSFVATEARAASAGEGADPHFVERISLYIVSI